MAPPNWPRPSRVGLHLLALSGVAIAMPLLAVLADNSTFFVVHGAGPGRIVATTVAIVMAPAALLSLPYWTATRLGWAHAYRLAAVAVWILAVLAGIQTAMWVIAGPPSLLIALGLATGTLLAWAYPRIEVLRQFLGYLALAPVLMGAAFLFTAPIDDLVRPGGIDLAGATATGEPPPVVVLVLDEIPTASLIDEEGGIDSGRFPNLARLSTDGTWYPNATSVAAYTHEALPAIVTGRYVAGADVPPTAAGHPESLFTLLAGTYDMRSLEQTTRLCPPELCDTPGGSDNGVSLFLADLAAVYGNVALPEGARPGIPVVDEAWSRYWHAPRISPINPNELAVQRSELKDLRDEVVSAMASEDRVGEFLAAVAQIEAADVPTLDFIHLALPHMPWLFHADGSSYGDLDQVGLENQRWTDQFAADFALQRHLLQVQFVDGLVGAVLARLDEIGTYDEATIVVVGDHAMSFEVGEHRRLATADTFTSMMPTPLLIKPPAAASMEAPRRVDEPVETIDVLPTLAALIGYELPWEVDGVDLGGDVSNGRDRRIYNRGSTFETHETPIAERDALRTRIVDLFGAGSGFEPYALAGTAELLGRQLGEPSPEDGLCWSVTDQPEPGGPTTAWVTGILEGSEGDDAVAVAVLSDGVVAATTRTHGENHAVTAVTDPRYWVAGGEVDVAVLDPATGGQPTVIARCGAAVGTS